MNKDSDARCCPPPKQERWQDKTHEWKDKRFMVDHVMEFWHMPLHIGAVIQRMWKKAQDAGAEVKPDDFMLLATDLSPWRGELYMTTTKDVPDANMVKLSGKYLSRIYEGPYGTEPKWLKEQQAYLETKGLTADKHYFYYMTCPKCAKKYGQNYVTLFSKIAS